MTRPGSRLSRCLVFVALVVWGGCALSDPRVHESPDDLTALPETPHSADVVIHLKRLRVYDEWLRDYAQRLAGHVDRPWTVERLAAAKAAEEDAAQREALVYLLAASRTSLGLRVAGLALDDEPDVAIAAARGIEQYWMGVTNPIGGADALIEDSRAWWERWSARNRKR